MMHDVKELKLRAHTLNFLRTLFLERMDVALQVGVKMLYGSILPSSLYPMSKILSHCGEV